MKHKCFTLVELLVVIAIIGILAGFISTAIVKSMDGAKKRRHEGNRVALKAAVIAYWHDYGHWPIADTARIGDCLVYTNDPVSNVSHHNSDVFKCLYSKNEQYNPRKCTYLDEKRFDLSSQNLLSDRFDKEGKNKMPYRLIINFRTSEVKIWPCKDYTCFEICSDLKHQ